MAGADNRFMRHATKPQRLKNKDVLKFAINYGIKYPTWSKREALYFWLMDRGWYRLAWRIRGKDSAYHLAKTEPYEFKDSLKVTEPVQTGNQDGPHVRHMHEIPKTYVQSPKSRHIPPGSALSTLEWN